MRYQESNENLCFFLLRVLVDACDSHLRGRAGIGGLAINAVYITPSL